MDILSQLLCPPGSTRRQKLQSEPKTKHLVYCVCKHHPILFSSNSKMFFSWGSQPKRNHNLSPAQYWGDQLLLTMPFSNWKLQLSEGRFCIFKKWRGFQLQSKEGGEDVSADLEPPAPASFLAAVSSWLTHALGIQMMEEPAILAVNWGHEEGRQTSVCEMCGSCTKVAFYEAFLAQGQWQKQQQWKRHKIENKAPYWGAFLITRLPKCPRSTDTWEGP